MWLASIGMPRLDVDPETNERPERVGPDADALLTARWRAMTVTERAALVQQMCHDVEVMAIAGIRATNPRATEREIRHELARRRFGDELADEAFASTSHDP